MYPLSISNYFELGAFIISVLAYGKLRGTSFRFFPFFLFIIVLVEFAGRYIRMVLLHKNAWLYNISTTLEFVFYAYIFQLQLRDPALKKAASRFMFIYPILVLLNLLFVQGFMQFHSYTMVLGSIAMIVFCCLYFYELLQNPLEGELRRDPMFWISSGILFFYLGDLSYNLLFNLLQKYAANNGGRLFQSINNNLILMLYSCFIIAFLCRRNPRKSLSP
ncbi:MAG TPA: hypothetical protein VL832_21325 [Puia sp.]|jgi:hypothetical protein|nr:hypothetical protein [Puia sp.]